MSRKVNITVLIYILWFALYGLFGKQDSNVWALAYYVVEPCFVILFLHYLKEIANTIKRVINIAIGFQGLRIAYNTVDYIYPELGRSINDNIIFLSSICVIIVLCLIKEIKAK